MRNAIQSVLSEPPVADPPSRVRRDWVLLAVLAITAVTETLVRSDLRWPALSLLICLALLTTVLWRRTHPLAMLTVALVGINITDLIARPFSEVPLSLYTSAFVLILVYAVFRWASGRHGVIAFGLMVAVLLLNLSTAYTGLGDAIGGILVFFAPAELGRLARYQLRSRHQEIEERKLREREQLARELHDTVAHHVSAIAIRAQAGRALASSNPDAAVEALEVIEEQASRTLSEMRTMVSALRGSDAPEFSPQPGVADIARLAGESDGELPVRVDIDGDFGELSLSVDAALYRIAQESITNAKRHAKRASYVKVSLTSDADFVRLTVRDDGHEGLHISAPSAEPVDMDDSDRRRFGLIGMAERAKLLGGFFHAGFCLDGGWSVEAAFPRSSSRSQNSLPQNSLSSAMLSNRSLPTASPRRGTGQ